MTEFWKSNPRKQCDFCKCWIADNKASIEFHEKGKNHQENVKRRLAQVKKKAAEKRKQDELFSKEFAAMEAAALKAVQKDLQNDPGIVGTNDLRVLVKDSNQTQESTSTEDKGSANKATWIACQAPQGYTYYYNQQTGESQWQMPEELAEKKETLKKEQGKITMTDDDQIHDSCTKSSSKDAKPNQAQQVDSEKHPLLGGWTTVAISQESETVEEAGATESSENGNDHSLPSSSEKTTDPEALSHESRKRTAVFKEKTVKSLQSTVLDENVGFKKRKVKNSRNVRKRGDNED